MVRPRRHGPCGVAESDALAVPMTGKESPTHGAVLLLALLLNAAGALVAALLAGWAVMH